MKKNKRFEDGNWTVPAIQCNGTHALNMAAAFLRGNLSHTWQVQPALVHL